MTRSVHRACSVASHGAGQLVGFMMRIPIAAASSLKHNDQVFQKVQWNRAATHPHALAASVQIAVARQESQVELCLKRRKAHKALD